MRPLAFIVNADDLGWSQEINDAIFLAMERGQVTSATIMANGGAFDDAVQRAKTMDGRCSFGVHLNLTAGTPLTRSEALQRQLNAAGHLSRGIVRRIPAPALAAAIATEMEAQIEKVRSAGVMLSHLDSHHHVHCVPWLTPIFKHAQRRTGIERMRLSENVFAPPKNRAHIRLGLKRLLNAAIRHYPATRTTDWFCDFTGYLNCLKAGVAPRAGIVELMTHPGAGGERYKAEEQLLASDWRKAIGGQSKLITYHDI